jgi:hypothetical protein
VPVRALAALRWVVLAGGVGLTTLSFVRLVEEHDRALGASPWWWLGLLGMVVTALALGSPWPVRSRGDDDASPRDGS